MKCKHGFPESFCQSCKDLKKRHGYLFKDCRSQEDKAKERAKLRVARIQRTAELTGDTPWEVESFIETYQREEYRRQEKALMAQAQQYLPPRGTGRMHRSAGVCEVCDKHRPAGQIVLRCLVVGDDGLTTGTRVCTTCSPHVSDEVVERFSMEYDDWEYSWKAHLDGVVVG
jgi:hypothetical protein